MAMNSEAPVKPDYSGGVLEQRVAAVEARVADIERAMLAADFAALRAAIRRVSFETAMWLAAVFCIAAITTAVYSIWFAWSYRKIVAQRALRICDLCLLRTLFASC